MVFFTQVTNKLSLQPGGGGGAVLSNMTSTKFLLTFIEAVRDVPANEFPNCLITICEHLLVLVFKGLLSFYVDTEVHIKRQIVLFSVASIFAVLYLSCP